MKELLHVGLFNDSFPPQIDGVANAVMNYARILQKQYGYALVAAPFYPDADDSAYPFKVVRYQSIDVSEWVGYRAGNPLDPKAIDRISQEPLDIVHAHCPVTAVMLGRSIRETKRIPMVFTYHTKFDIDIRNAISAKLLQEAAIKALVHNIECCDDVWVVSKGAGENLRSLGYKGNYTVMENGVDVPKGKAEDSQIDSVKKEFELDPSIPVFLYVGRMMWYKGIRITLDALKKLRENGNTFRMIFVGSGIDFDEIKAYSDSLGLSDFCIFTGPIHDREKLRAIYSAADLFLFPSTFDTNGLVVREAAASGLASILIENSCAAEGVQDGKNGVLISENADDMARALINLCQSREKMSQLGENAMNDLYCSWEMSVLKAAQRYKDVIKDFTPRFQPLVRPDDAFYKSIGDTYTALSKMRNFYNLEKEKRDLRINEQLKAYSNRVTQNREALENLREKWRQKAQDMVEEIREQVDYYKDLNIFRRDDSGKKAK